MALCNTVSYLNVHKSYTQPGSLESFKLFQAGLKENLEVPPKVETSKIVDSSFDLF